MTDSINKCSENIKEDSSTAEETNKDSLDDNSTLNNDNKHSVSDAEYDSESDTEPEPSSRYSFNTKSKKYVIMISDRPVFYSDNLETARNIMWEVAREIKRDFFNTNLFIYEGKNEDQITISVKHKYFLISYEKIIHTLNIFTIYESTFLKEESDIMETTDKEESDIMETTDKEESNEESKDSQESKYSTWQHLLFTS